MAVLLAESMYFPPIIFFKKLLSVDTYLCEVEESYIKQTDRNRCQILTSEGIKSLTVPILHTGSKIIFKDVKIDQSQSWARNHLRTMQAAYGKSPFFEFYKEDIENILMTKSPYLIDLNIDIMTFCLKAIDFSIHINKTVEYKTDYSNEVLDVRNQIVNNKNINQEEDFFVDYSQMFGSKFVSNLSVIDLISNCGYKSYQYLL